MVAMTEKRMRDEEGTPGDASGAQRQRVEENTLPYQGTRSRTQAARAAAVGSQESQQPQPRQESQQPVQTQPRAQSVQHQSGCHPQAQIVPAPNVQGEEDPAEIPPTLPSGAPQWQHFVPDPRFEHPANWDPNFPPPTFEPSAKTKIRKTFGVQNKRTGVPKTPRHIKMMKGKLAWDPVEALRNMHVTGLDFGNLLDWSPGVRIVLGRAMQLEPDELRKRTKARLQEGEHAVCAIQDTMAGYKQTRTKERAGILTEPTIRVLNFHTTGVVWSLWGTGTGYRIGKILID